MKKFTELTKNPSLHLFVSMMMFNLSLILLLNFYIQITSWIGYLLLVLSHFFVALCMHFTYIKFDYNSKNKPKSE